MDEGLKNFIKANVKKKTFLGKMTIRLKRWTVYLLIKYWVFCKQWLKIKRYELCFKDFYKNAEGMVKIIVADFGNYPLYRKKKIGGIVKCGIGNLFENMAKFKAGVPYDIILAINLVDNTEEKKGVYNSLQKEYPFIKKVIFRKNVGFDFGAYNEGYQYLRSIDYKGDVLFINSSSRGPSHGYWLLKYLYLFHRKEHIGLCGISLNSLTTHLENEIFKPHVQSFFMYTSMEILTKVFNDSLPGSDLTSGNKEDIISRGEIEFSQRIIDNGYGICSTLFENFVYYKNCEWEMPFGDMRSNEIYRQFANKI